MLINIKKIVLEASEKKKKPYKGFKKGKNHPEGGLSRAEAKRQGIHAGIETKREAQRKGGFGKLSSKTKKRRKSFCARMCGMKKRRTSAKTARDPKSKINAALRVWGCKCGTNESYTPILEKTGLEKACWKGYKAIGTKMKNGRKVPNCVPVNETLLRIQRMNIVEEIVNMNNAGSMTDAEIAKRDRLAKKLKNIKPIKAGDSQKNAKFRYATFIVLRNRKKAGTEKTTKGKKKK